ncbi:glycosyltransferase [Ruminococcaceae bacterium OttesenSCG-928-L11]|nr:glycosyltransferase [Ruminococcaceae bacterium OttesenSCG-928-L11]
MEVEKSKKKSRGSTMSLCIEEKQDNKAYLKDDGRIREDCTFEQLLGLYDKYKQLGLLKATGQLLPALFSKAYKTKEHHDRFVGLLNEDIFRLDERTEAEGLLSKIAESILLNRGEKPVLAFHIYGWLYGGAERVLTMLTNELSKRYTIIIIAFGPVVNTSFSLNTNIVFVPILGDHYADGIDRLLRLLLFLSPNIFIGNNNSIPDLTRIYPILSEIGIKTIANCHEYYFFPHNNNFLCQFATNKNHDLAYADAVVYLTNFSAEAYGLLNHNGVVIPNPNTFQEQETDLYNPEGKTIIAVGRFDDAIKRVDRMLRIFSMVLKEYTDSKLILIGPYDLSMGTPDGAEKSVGALIGELNIPEARIEFKGLQKDVADFYHDADVFLLTSDNEGFPMTLTEAGIYQLPSVIMEIPGLDDIIETGVNGFVVAQDDIEGAAKKISLLLTDKELRKKMSAKAGEMAKRFHITEVGKKWETLIDIILNESDDVVKEEKIRKHFLQKKYNEGIFCKKVIQEYEAFGRKIAQKALGK